MSHHTEQLAARPAKPISVQAHEVEEFIHRARVVMDPGEPQWRHVPNWLQRRMLKVFGCPPYGSNGWAVLHHAAEKSCSSNNPVWIDHCGSMKEEGHILFVSEPYGPSMEMMRQAEKFANDLGIDLYCSPNTWWFPGRTYRFAFSEGSRTP